ncbi:FMN-binding protein [Krasilnikovia sp. MM14-A1004]|uniref:FMN-binding protein n=1 Tax=Krasilnikovia sp. MM14-A1004 TaxID=3373541 RepID=UPI00399D1A23
MRRSTAAAVGTLTGAALIIGVRLSVSAPVVTAAPPAVDVANNDLGADPEPSKSSDKKKEKDQGDDNSGTAGGESGLTDGTFKGKPVRNPYGTVQVSIRVADGKISKVAATYPTTGESATINPAAIPQLKEQTLKAQSADIDAVSGATFTSKSYVESLQAALDEANA